MPPLLNVFPDEPAQRVKVLIWRNLLEENPQLAGRDILSFSGHSKRLKHPFCLFQISFAERCANFCQCPLLTSSVSRHSQQQVDPSRKKNPGKNTKVRRGENGTSFCRRASMLNVRSEWHIEESCTCAHRQQEKHGKNETDVPRRSRIEKWAGQSRKQRGKKGLPKQRVSKHPQLDPPSR